MYIKCSVAGLLRKLLQVIPIENCAIGTKIIKEITTKPFSKAVQELHRERLVEDVQVTNFGRELVEQMLTRKAKQSPPTELTDLVFSETEGNPFFVEELYRHLL